jgi:hypothetical protein
LFVSADYQLRPILAFIEYGEFKKDTVPSGLIQWANKTINNIEIVRKGLYDNSKSAKITWKIYLNQNTNVSSNKAIPAPNPCQSNPNYYVETSQTVGPLLPVTWGQSCSYNDLCPDLTCNDCNTEAETGCVATAMAQVIRYWQPTNSYSYNYTSMPATSGNNEAQRMMVDIGRSVSMNYDCGANGGSSASGGDVP